MQSNVGVVELILIKHKCKKTNKLKIKKKVATYIEVLQKYNV